MKIRVFLFAITALSLASADTLVLRDGKTVQGQFLGGSPRQIRMAVGDTVQTFSVTDVSSLQFEGSKPVVDPSAPAPTPSVNAAAQPAPAPSPEPDKKILHVEPTPAPAVASDVAVIPSGTPIVIRMIDGVDSKDARPGQSFKASVDDPVMVGDRVVIPRGADVLTKLVEVKDPSKLSGGGQLTLSLETINVNGKTINVNSETITTTGESKKGDSAKVIGGTTALGAIIGAIAGGGKGAAIGAVSGAGAGTAVRVLTSGAEVKVPSETRLTFTLQSAVKLI